MKQKIIITSGDPSGVGPEIIVKSRMYPNPVNDFIGLEFDRTLINPKVLISDINGRIVYSDILNSSRKTTLNIEWLKPGIYVISIIEKGKNISNHKFIKG